MSPVEHFGRDREADGGHHHDHHHARHLVDWHHQGAQEPFSLNHPIENVANLSNHDLNYILNHALSQNLFNHPQDNANNPFQQMMGYMQDGLKNLSDAANVATLMHNNPGLTAEQSSMLGQRMQGDMLGYMMDSAGIYGQLAGSQWGGTTGDGNIPKPPAPTPGANPGSDTGAATPGQGTTAQGPGGDLPPVAGKGGTPADGASALAGATYDKIDPSKPMITPQFGNGKSDTQAIQDAVNEAAAKGGGTVHIPAGTYNIDTVNDGVVMKDNVNLLMDKGTTLKAIPNDSDNGCIIDIRNVNNVGIYGGKLEGDFAQKTQHVGETSSGLDILGTSSHIDVQGVESDLNRGDGFDISGTGTDIHLAHNVASGNKRDGLSVEGGSNIMIEQNAFVNTGTADSYDYHVAEGSPPRLPNSGIDIENSPGQSNNGVVVRNNLIEGNGTQSIDADTSNGWGIRVTGSDGNNSSVIDNTIVGNVAGGVGVWSGSGNIVSGNIIEGPHPYEIFGGEASGSGNTDGTNEIPQVRG